MSALNFPLNPINGQQYPDPAIPGVNVYRYDSAANTWRLIGRAGYAVAGTYGDNTTCVEITIDAAGVIEQIYNRPITRTANTVYGINRPGIGLNVTPGNEGTLDLIPPLGLNIGGVKSGLNVAIAPDGSVSVASATTLVPGVVQLNDTTSSSSVTQALTAAAGKALQDQINALIVDALVFCGTYNASTSQMDYVTNEGGIKGFVVGQNIPAPTNALNGAFVIVSTPGTPVAPAPTQPVGSGDWIVCDIAPPQWVVVPIGRFIVASQVIFNPYNYVTATDVQTAIQTVVNRTNYFSLATGIGLTGGPFTLAGGPQTINLLPPAGTDIGGVKAGSNIVIATDGTISAVSGGTIGTVSQVNSGTGLTGGPITGSGTLSIANTGVTAGTYNYATLTVNAQGQLVSASTGVPVTSITAGTGLNGGTITSTGTIALADTTVTAGTYNYPTLTVNAQGQLTAVNSNTAVSSFTAGVGLSTTGSTGSITVELQPPTATVIGGVKAGTNISIDSFGAISVVSGGAVGTITGVTAGAGLTGGGVTGVVTLDVGAGTGITVNADNISISNTTVTAGSYTNANITVNAQGQITAASSSSDQAYHFVILDNISSGFNGTTTTFNLTIGSVAYTPSPVSNIMVFVGGIAQIPSAAYSITGSQITFTEAPATGATFYATTVRNT